MLQCFDDVADPTVGGRRVGLLRAELRRRGLAGFLVPRADEHQGEYVPPCAERLQWLSGFSGSAGQAVVLLEAAALFVDGRYILQAGAQVDGAVFETLQQPPHKLTDWLAARLKSGAALGYDPKLHTVKEVERLETAVAKAQARLVPQEDNPLDAVWPDRPPPPREPVVLHPLSCAGRPAAEKIAGIQSVLREASADAAVLTLPDSIAWLLNIRGRDIAHTPVVLCFAIVHSERPPELFIDPVKLTEPVRQDLAGVAVIHDRDALAGRLAALGAAGASVRLDPDTAARWFADRLRQAGAKVLHGPDPCLLPKARKNPTEIAGARAAHRRDGVALCRFLAWLDREAPRSALDEIAAAQHLEALRAESGLLKDLSFDTISAAGPNGAIVHYRVTKATNRRLEPGCLYLVDSGAQYEDGTTDVTRTVAVGEPGAEARRAFTLVLKGHVAIATARFPKDTRGQDLDPFARRALWLAGLDYDHGTGHGVGSYLSVHEGPHRLSRLGSVALEPGMIVSNEPGYYRTGAFGIRIENLLLVREPEEIAGGERAMMGFETLTLAPIDRRLIDPGLLTADERAWLDAYHARVLAEIGPALSGEDRRWLEQATAPLP